MNTWVSFRYTFDSNVQDDDILLSFSNEYKPDYIKMNITNDKNDGLRLTADNSGVIICRMTKEEYESQDDGIESSGIETFVSWYKLWKLHDLNACSLFQDYDSFTDEDDFTD